MRTASKIFYYVGVLLILVTAVIVIVRFHGKYMQSQQSQNLLMAQVKMISYHTVASACCFGLSKLLDRD